MRNILSTFMLISFSYDVLQEGHIPITTILNIVSKSVSESSETGTVPRGVKADKSGWFVNKSP